MGNSPNWKSEFLRDYQLVQDNHTDDRFGRIAVFQNIKDRKLVFRRSIPFGQQTKEAEQNYAKRVKIRNPYLLRVYHIDQKPNEFNCGSDSTSIQNGYWEYPGKKTLDQILEKKTQPWTEGQLWKIILQLLNAGQELQKIGLYHGDLRPENIFVQDDRILIAEYTLIPDLMNGYQRSLLNQDAYLSPQQLDSLQKRQPRPKADPYKSDIYTLGITLLQCASLQNPKTCYDMRTFEILESEIHNIQRYISGMYSACLLSFIQYCLTPSEQLRPSFIEAYNTLNQFERDIMNQEPFYDKIIICNCQDQQHYQVTSKIMVNSTKTNNGHVITASQVLPSKFGNPSNSILINQSVNYSPSQSNQQLNYAPQINQSFTPPTAQYYGNSNVISYSPGRVNSQNQLSLNERPPVFIPQQSITYQTNQVQPPTTQLQFQNQNFERTIRPSSPMTIKPDSQIRSVSPYGYPPQISQTIRSQSPLPYAQNQGLSQNSSFNNSTAALNHQSIVPQQTQMFNQSIFPAQQYYKTGAQNLVYQNSSFIDSPQSQTFQYQNGINELQQSYQVNQMPPQIQQAVRSQNTYVSKSINGQTTHNYFKQQSTTNGMSHDERVQNALNLSQDIINRHSKNIQNDNL